MPFDFFGHAVAGIRDDERDILAGVGRGRGTNGVTLEDDIFRGDGYLAALRHGITGINDQIHQQLPDVTEIGLDAPDFFP